MIIDFFGLPGCGKSTVSHLLAEKLRENGFIVREVSFEMDHGTPALLRPIKKIYALLILRVKHRDIAVSVGKLVKKNGYGGIQKLRQDSNIAYKVNAILKQSDNGIIIMDQGLIQSAISLSVNSEIDVNENAKALIAAVNDMPHTALYLKTSESVALARLDGRKGKCSRVERVSDGEEKMRVIEKIYGLCESVKPDDLTVTNADGSPESILTDVAFAIFAKLGIGS